MSGPTSDWGKQIVEKVDILTEEVRRLSGDHRNLMVTVDRLSEDGKSFGRNSPPSKPPLHITHSAL
jgi:hypothetical protein